MSHPRTSPATPGADMEDRMGTESRAGAGDRSGDDRSGGDRSGGDGSGGDRSGGDRSGVDRTITESRTATPPSSDTPDTPLALTPPTALRTHLAARLDSAPRAWLHRALDEAAANPGTHGPISVWELRIAEAGRRCGQEYADAVRVLILHAADADPDALARVYSQGTAAERRAVLYALAHLVPGPDALPLVEDALRTNDTRLVAAAVGPYAARHLDPHQWRHAVLKCLFTGVPVATVADLDRRAHGDAELARMLGDYAAERTAAGRPVPVDLHRVLTLTDPMATPPASTAQRGGRGTDGKES
ncbi:EboA domain-containing protein [Streptomyces sp. NPDC093568]|uniref:EboA domain-containing protein n=1 Tax=Streptomyces sp. NPDC093568 TaxID=3366041 RepID=UPI0038214756